MEDKIKDAEIEVLSGENHEEAKAKKANVELALFLILGFLLGVVIKTEAGKRITIGFEDYKIAALQRGYDLNVVVKNATERAKAEQEENGDASTADNGAAGGTCSN